MAGVDACESVLLYGGVDETGPTVLGDTWLWNGAAWTQVPVSAPTPGPRWDHAMASVPGAVVLFGGNDPSSKALGDTWLWNGTAWSGPSGTGPSARYGHAMAGLPSGQVVLFGGSAPGAFEADTWGYSVSSGSWTSLATTGPGARWLHAMATLGNDVVLFGGADSGTTTFGDTWIWNGTSWSEPAISGPTPPARFGAVMVPVAAGLLLYGGQGQLQDGGYPILADGWLWDGSSWACVSNCNGAAPTGPGMRVNSAMSADVGGTALLFGGDTRNMDTVGDTWTWSSGWSAASVAPAPIARDSHAMAFFQP